MSEIRRARRPRRLQNGDRSYPAHFLYFIVIHWATAKAFYCLSIVSHVGPPLWRVS